LNVNTSKRLLAVLTAGALAVGTMAGCPSNPNIQPAPAQTTEQEDCDLGDRLEGDSDCDDEGSKHRKAKPKKKDTSKPKSGLFGGSGKQDKPKVTNTKTSKRKTNSLFGKRSSRR
jgi:hypothetical protein